MKLDDRLKQAIRPAPPGTPTLAQVLADQPDDQGGPRHGDGKMAVTLRDIDADPDAPPQPERAAA